MIIFGIEHTVSMIGKNRHCTHVSVQIQIHKTYNQNISGKDVMQFAMQYILNFLEFVSHIKTLQDLSNKW